MAIPLSDLKQRRSRQQAADRLAYLDRVLVVPGVAALLAARLGAHLV